MADSISVSGPVEIESDSDARVAYDLMKFISSRENISEDDKKSRKYWLTLYYQCVLASKNATSLNYILKPE